MKIGLMWASTGIMLALPMVHANAQPASADADVVVERAWTRATDADNRSAAIYFTLRNIGQATVDLIGVRTDRASIETLHKTTINTKGVVRMSAMPELRVDSGETFMLEPGGMHVMLIDLETPLIEGETLPLRLKFYDGDDLIVEVPILGADASGPSE